MSPSRGNHLSTGFLGTPFLLSVLQDGGRGDVAYKILTQDSYPSWGYMLGRGGTTIWERWDGIRPDGALQDAGHELVQPLRPRARSATGSTTASAASRRRRPGYKTQLVKPSTGPELTSASSAVKTSYGEARTSWSRDAAGRLGIDVDVPVNTRAEVHVPIADGQQALESGKPANTQPGVTYKGTTNGDAVYEVGSGSYRFLAATVDATSVDSPVAGTVPATLRSPSHRRRFGPFTPGLAKDYTTDAGGHGHEHGRRRRPVRPRPERDRARPPRQRRLRARRSRCRPTARPSPGASNPTAAEELDRPGQQRPADDRASSSRSPPTTRCAPAATARR